MAKVKVIVGAQFGRSAEEIVVPKSAVQGEGKRDGLVPAGTIHLPIP